MLRLGHIFALWLISVSGSVNAQDIQFFSIATGGVSGTYYPVGGMIADVISQPPGARPCERGGSCGVPNLVAIASSSEGSIANVRAIASGAADSGFVQSDVAYDALIGEGAFAASGPIEDLRLIASLYVEHAHVIARDVTTIDQFRGKRISLDLDGSGTRRVAELIIEAHGLEDSDIEMSQLPPNRSIQAMRSDALDGFIVVAGYPTPSVIEATGTLDATLLPLSRDAIDKLIAKHAFFSATAIPPATYPAQDTVLPTIGVVAQWLTSAEMSEELVYGITRSLWHPTSRLLLDSGHHRGRAVTLETALDGAAVPLHAGAERFYREQGLISD